MQSVAPNYNSPFNPVLPQQQQQPNGGSTEFPTGINPQMTATTPIPPANPLNTQALATNKLADVTAQGDQAQANASQQAAQSKSSSGSSAGGILGAIGGIGKAIGSIFSFLAEGGPVTKERSLPGDKLNGFADGGEVEDKNNKAFGLGYAVGALHQRDYGGTPDTLQEAANKVASVVQPHMASGGAVNPTNDDSVQNAIMQSLGMVPDNASPSTDTAQIQRPPVAPAPNVAQNIPNGQPQVATTQQPNPMAAKKGGFMDEGMDMERLPQMPTPGMAEGGSSNQNDGTFEGDGKVVGQGGPEDDAIPAKLSNGEFVMSAPATQFWGVDKLAKMNDQGKQGFLQRTQEVESNQSGNANAPSEAQGTPAPSSLNAPIQQQVKGGISMNKRRGFMGM